MILTSFFQLLIWSSQLRLSEETLAYITEGETAPSTDSYLRVNWTTWKLTFQRHYRSNRFEKERFNDWRNNLILLERHNANFAKGKELFSVEMNKFADTSAKTLIGTYLPNVSVSVFYEELTPKKLKLSQPPENFDWSDNEWFSKIFKSRGCYHDGWAFSVTRVVEAHVSKQLGHYATLSRQEVIDCAPRFSNQPQTALDGFWYFLSNGVTWNKHYPLRSFQRIRKRRDCARRSYHCFVRIKDFHLLQPNDEENLKSALYVLGPISVSIKVTQKFFFYKSGVFFDPMCNIGQLSVNHAVVLTGYGSDPVAGNFWVIQNSWGSYWGENGYVRMARNTLSDCCVAAAALYPVI